MEFSTGGGPTVQQECVPTRGSRVMVWDDSAQRFSAQGRPFRARNQSAGGGRVDLAASMTEANGEIDGYEEEDKATGGSVTWVLN